MICRPGAIPRVWGDFLQGWSYSAQPAGAFVPDRVPPWYCKGSSRLAKGNAGSPRHEVASRRCTQCAVKVVIQRYTHRFQIVTQFGVQQTHANKRLDFGYV